MKAIVWSKKDVRVLQQPFILQQIHHVFHDVVHAE